jgi:hypothetical protein
VRKAVSGWALPPTGLTLPGLKSVVCRKVQNQFVGGASSASLAFLQDAFRHQVCNVARCRVLGCVRQLCPLGQGADVVICYLSEDQHANDTAGWVEKEDRRALVLPGDITREEPCSYLVRQCIEHLSVENNSEEKIR